MGLPYHTHDFEVPEASADEVSQRLQVSKFITPDKLPEIVEYDPADFATAAQGATADTALQPSAIGVTVQAYDADLTAWAGVNPSSYSTTVQIAAAYQPLDPDLTTLAGLTATTDNFIVSVASAWASRTPTQVRTTLGLTVGTDVQAYDSGLDALAAFNTNGILVQTANNTFAGRTLTGTSAQITVTNGDGVSGNPTLSLPADVLIPTVLTVPNTGLHILDTNASHDLIVKPGSDITADRTLTITTGDADRTLTISASATVSQDYSTTGNPQFATIELGHATQNTLSASGGNLSIEGNAVYRAGGTDVPITDGGTGASDAATALTNLGAIGNSLLTTRGDIITRGAAAPQRLALGTNGYYLKSDGTDAVWAAAVGGGWTTLSGPTSLSGSALGFTSISSSYADLMIVCSGLSGTNSADLRIEISVDNGSNYSTARAIASALSNGGTYTSAILIIGYLQGIGSVIGSVTSSAAASPHVSGTSGSLTATFLGTGGINAARVSLSAGTFDAGTITLLAR